MAKRYRAVIVSPHLDDAVFSCGGEIDRLAKEGPVLVLNLFTRYLADIKIRGVVLGEERYQEEADAADFLGYESHNMGELDVTFRRDAYRSLGNIFRPPVDEDMAWLPELREKVFLFLAGLEFEQLYVPLGIGWHVDHVLTHLVFEPWAGRAGLLYYEDAPYCLIPHTTRYRLNELGAYSWDENDASLTPSSELRAWWQCAMAYADTALMKNLKPWIVRQSAIPVVSFYLYRLMALHRHCAKQRPNRQWIPVVMPLGSHFDRKLAAMTLYRSQFREFFSDEADCKASLFDYAARMSERAGPVERYWRPAE